MELNTETVTGEEIPNYEDVCARAGYGLPLDIIHKKLLEGNYCHNVTLEASLYLAVVLDCLCAEAVELSGKIAMEARGEYAMISASDVVTGFFEDEELKQLVRRFESEKWSVITGELGNLDKERQIYPMLEFIRRLNTKMYNPSISEAVAGIRDEQYEWCFADMTLEFQKSFLSSFHGNCNHVQNLTMHHSLVFAHRNMLLKNANQINLEILGKKSVEDFKKIESVLLSCFGLYIFYDDDIVPENLATAEIFLSYLSNIFRDAKARLIQFSYSIRSDANSFLQQGECFAKSFKDNINVYSIQGGIRHIPFVNKSVQFSEWIKEYSIGRRNMELAYWSEFDLITAADVRKAIAQVVSEARSSTKGVSADICSLIAEYSFTDEKFRQHVIRNTRANRRDRREPWIYRREPRVLKFFDDSNEEEYDIENPQHQEEEENKDHEYIGMSNEAYANEKMQIEAEMAEGEFQIEACEAQIKTLKRKVKEFEAKEDVNFRTLGRLEDQNPRWSKRRRLQM